jgi:carotenoid cleavage dioxygenase-like enzyme
MKPYQGASMAIDTPATNRYLEGPFAPVGEERTITELEVTGTIPAELDGRYVRNGPNPIGADPDSYHWFTGSGMVHGVRLRDGRAEWYRNRWVRDAKTAAALGEADPGGPSHNEGGDGPVNTNVVSVAGRSFAIVEAGSFPIELTDELDTVARNPFDGTLATSYSAHPKPLPDGELHAVTYWWPEESIHHVVVGADGRVRRDVEIPVGGRPMVHDLALSATRAALFDLPVQFDLEAAMEGTPLPYRWDEDREARVGLLPLDGTAEDVVWCSVDPCFVYHPANAVDLPDGSFQVELVRHPSSFRTDRHGPIEGPPVLARWTVDPSSGKVREEILDDLSVEFPRFDDRQAGGAYRYAYASSLPLDDRADGSVVRYDLRTGGREGWQPGAGRFVGEVVFVPRDGSTSETDGWLVGYVHDELAGQAELVVLAADDLAGGPVAAVHLPTRIPIGFHGNWLPAT